MFARYLILLFLLLFPSIAHADILTGLLAYWKFDEGSGLSPQDSSGSGYTLSAAATPTWVPGQVGAYATALNGTTQYWKLADQTALHLTTNWTYSAWVYESSVTSNQPTIEGYDNGATGFVAALNIIINGNTGNYVSVTEQNGTNGVNINGSIILSATTWYLVTVTHGSGNTSIYINGVLDTTQAERDPSFAVSAGSLGLTIGAFAANHYMPSGTEFFAGNIDDVRIYNRTLTASDVVDLYNYGFGMYAQGLTVKGGLIVK